MPNPWPGVSLHLCLHHPKIGRLLLGLVYILFTTLNENRTEAVMGHFSKDGWGITHQVHPPQLNFSETYGPNHSQTRARSQPNNANAVWLRSPNQVGSLFRNADSSCVRHYPTTYIPDVCCSESSTFPVISSQRYFYNFPMNWWLNPHVFWIICWFGPLFLVG